MRMWRFAAFLLALMMMTVAARATGTISCTAIDGSDAEISILVGLTPVLRPLDVTIAAQGSRWSTRADDAGAATEIALLQAFDEPNWMAIDVTDINLERTLASIRIIRGEEMKSAIQLAILKLDGIGVYALACEGP